MKISWQSIFKMNVTLEKMHVFKSMVKKMLSC